MAILVVIGLGLASRKFPGMFPAALGKYPGDALWALMVFLGLGFVFPKLPIWKAAVLALGFSFAVEAGQLYQAPWIRSVRATTPGHLVLGSAFGWYDFVAYAVGVLLGTAGELIARGRLMKKHAAGGKIRSPD